MYATIMIDENCEFTVSKDSDVNISEDNAFVMEEDGFFHAFCDRIAIMYISKNGCLIYEGVLAGLVITTTCVKGDVFKVTAARSDILVFEVATSKTRNDTTMFEDMYDRHDVAGAFDFVPVNMYNVLKLYDDEDRCGSQTLPIVCTPASYNPFAWH